MIDDAAGDRSHRPLLLAEASVQDIQLELMRRRRFNEFDGPTVVASLRRHRALWIGAVMDSFGFGQQGSGATLPGFGSLIKLRDIQRDTWNVDDLYLLCRTLADARRLAEIASAERWQADNVVVHENDEERSNALGMSHPLFLVSFWWD